MKVAFILRRGISDKRTINEGTLFGFVRGLQKAWPKVTFIGSIEYDSNEKNYVVKVEIPRKQFEMVKGQAESYMSVKVVELDKWGRFKDGE